MEPNHFQRWVVGETQGDEVYALQQRLLALGEPLPESETGPAVFGVYTKAAAERFIDQLIVRDIVENAQDRREHHEFIDYLIELLGRILNLGYGEEDLQSFIENPDYTRGDSRTVEYRTADDVQMQALQDAPLTSTGAIRVVEYARHFLGQREEGDNRGRLVRLFTGGPEGMAYCGYAMHHWQETIFDRMGVENPYGQADYASAQSYMRFPQQIERGTGRNIFNTRDEIAANRNYLPQPGDVVVFSRGGGRGHVGIVSEVASDGTVTYISANDGNAVRERSFNLRSLPASLLGISDTHALAAAQNIDLGVSSQLGANALTPAHLARRVEAYDPVAVRQG